MRLDATTAEVVSFLVDRGFSVAFPIDADVTDEHARVALKGNHFAIVTRDDNGTLRAAVECNTPPVERFTYHDLLTVSIALQKRSEAVAILHADVCGKLAFRAKASEYADEINRLADLRRKVSGILRAERAAQYAAEAQEAAARG